MNFYEKYKYWIALVAVFLLARVVIFATFWQASLDQGGWDNFYDWAQPAKSVLMINFHDYCDWHPPLYYFFTSVLLTIFQSQWAIYLAQIVLAFIGLTLVYKIAKLFFSEKIALISVFIIAIEPYWAWNNWLLASENLSTPLLLAGFYFLFRFLIIHPAPPLQKEGVIPPFYKGRLGGIFAILDQKNINLIYSSIFFGLATLTRPNTLLLPLALSLILIIVFFLKRKLDLNILDHSAKQFFIFLLFFNVLFLAILFPWMLRNKNIYDNFILANMMSTNIYFYNLPPLISLKQGISYSEAQVMVYAQAEKDLGKNVADQGDCSQFSKGELSKQFNYYETQAKEQILASWPTYLKIHLIKAVPFFFQPGNFDMWSAYTGEYSKPDITALVLKGDLSKAKEFFKDINLKLVAYLAELIFWGLASLSLLIACVYSYLRDKRKPIFFLIALAVILYNALLISPFVLARYRMPIYIFFIVPLVYVVWLVYNHIRKGNEGKSL